MASIVTRQTAGGGATVNNAPLSNLQLDNNFININNDLADKASITGTYSNPSWITSLSETKVLPTQTGQSGKYLTTDGTATSWATVSLPSGLTAGSTSTGYLQYSGTTATAGQLNGGSTNPSNTTRLNYDGYLYATNLYTNALQSIASSLAISVIGVNILTMSTNGTERLRITSGGSIGIGTTSPSYLLSLEGNSARTIGMERHTTANTAGNDLTIQAGGTTSGATDKVGGNLVLSSGISSGNVGSAITFLTPTPGTTGTTDRTPSEKMRLDASGNLGLGVTPSAWSAHNVIDIGARGGVFSLTSSGAFGLMQNAYWTGSAYAYKQTAAATYYNQTTGLHQWYNAPSGTAGATTTVVKDQVYTVTTLGSTTLAQWQALFSGLAATPSVGQTITATAGGTLAGGATVTQNVTFTQAMTLDASGNLGVGTTSPGARFETVVSGNALYFSGGDSSVSRRLQFNSATTTNTGDTQNINALGSTGVLVFSTNSTERARISSTGGLSVGSTTDPGAGGIYAAGSVTIFKTTTVTVGTNGGSDQFQIQNNSSGAALMSFHRNGAYAINMGLDTDNVFRLGGHSTGANTYRWTSDTSGNFVAQGNVTAYSDRRLKKDLSRIEGALDKVVALTGYTFTRTDTNERQTGLIAQEVQDVLPEAVHDDGNQLSLAYGNLVGLLVEAIKELRSEVAALKGV